MGKLGVELTCKNMDPLLLGMSQSSCAMSTYTFITFVRVERRIRGSKSEVGSPDLFPRRLQTDRFPHGASRQGESYVQSFCHGGWDLDAVLMLAGTRAKRREVAVVRCHCGRTQLAIPEILP